MQGGVFAHICISCYHFEKEKNKVSQWPFSSLWKYNNTITTLSMQNEQVAELPHLTHLWPPSVPCQPAAGDAFPTMASATCPSSDNSLGPFTSPFPCFSETPLSTAACRKAVQVLLHNHVFPDLWCLLCWLPSAPFAAFYIAPHYVLFLQTTCPGSSCTLPLKVLLYKQWNCVNKRTILSSNMNSSCSLTMQCKLWLFRATSE